MFKKYTSWGGLAYILLCPLPLLAQDTFSIRLEQQAKPLTLVQALELTRSQNQELLKARNNILRAEAGVRAAKAAWLPSASLNSSYSGQKSGALNYSDTLGAQGQLDWSLYDAGRQAQIESALLTLDRARLDLKTQDRAISLQLTEAYYDLQQADSSLTIQEAAVREAEANLGQTRNRLQAGAATRYDVLQQEVQLANSRQLLLSAQNTQARNRLILADILNLGQSLPVQAVDPVEPHPDWTQPLEATLKQAINQRPELAALETDQAISRAQQQVINSQVLPKVTLSAGYGYANFLRGSNQDQLTVSANLNWVVFDGGASVAQQEQLSYDQRNSALDLTKQAQQIRTAIEQAYLAKETGKAQIDSAKVAVNQATESLALVRLRQQVGVSLQIEVITAERALTEARQNYVNAVISYNRALSELALALGV